MNTFFFTMFFMLACLGVGLFLAVLLLPVLVLLCPVLWGLGRFSGYPCLFFRQERIGLHESPIQIFKFRTMKRESGELRTNAVFWVVRKLGLDELPQILLVFRGTMSFVGPRPLLRMSRVTI